MHISKIMGRWAVAGVLCAFGMGGCEVDPMEADAADEDLPEWEDRASGLSPVEQALFDAVCTPTHFVARKSAPGGGGCPKASGFLKERLFPNSMFAEGVPPRLALYCRYAPKSSGTDPTAAQVAALRKMPAFAEVKEDCEAIQSQAPQADAITAAVAPELREWFAWRNRFVDAGTLADADASGQRTPVRVAVIDTQPEAPIQPPPSTHGESMMDIIGDIACPGASCAVNIVPVLGLPRTADGGLDLVNGGRRGRQSDLARAVVEAVEDWRADGTEPHLILNLSVAWEDGTFGDLGAAGEAAVRSIYDALRHANCARAAVVSAVGNSSGIQCVEEGPMLPSAWNTISRPDAATCNSEFAIAGSQDPGPLTSALTGMHRLDSEMGATRSGGVSRLAAVASHAVAGPNGSPTFRVPLSGTSVAAAVASGAAALAWSFDPGLSANQVMGLLYQSGSTVDDAESDFGYSGSGEDLHRINVCAALDEVCAGGNGACSDLVLPLDCQTPPPVTLTDLFSTIQDLPTHSSTIEYEPNPTVCSVACGDNLMYAPLGKQVPCEAVENDPLQPFTQPQPGGPPCPTCPFVAATSTVLAATDPELDAFTLNEAFVSLMDGDTGTWGRYPVLDVSGINSATIEELELEGTVPTNVRQASITMTYSIIGECSNALLIE